MAEAVREEIKRMMRESLVYAVSTSIKGKNERLIAREVITEFYHSLNRKQFLLSSEVDQEIAEALKQLEDLGENWKYVAN